MIGGNAARAMEAELYCVGALWSPEAGIFHSHRSCWRCGANLKTAAA